MRKRYQAFADCYLGLIKDLDPPVPAWNATEAAIYAGYKPRSAYNQGMRLMKNDEVQAYMQAQLNAMQMGPEETKTRLAEQARGEYAKYILESGDVDIASMIADGKGHLIKKISKNKWSKDGATSHSEGESMVFEFVDGQNALIHIGKIHKLFTEKTEIELGDKLTAKLNQFADLTKRIYGEPDPEP